MKQAEVAAGSTETLHPSADDGGVDNFPADSVEPSAEYSRVPAARSAQMSAGAEPYQWESL